MYLLPLKFITYSDRPIVGDEIVSLATLQKKGIPVAQTYILFPPDQIHSELKILNPEQFARRLEEKFSWETLKELENVLDLNKVKSDVFESWVNQHSSKSKSLKPLSIIISPDNKKIGKSFLNSRKHLEILPQDDKLPPNMLLTLEEIIKKASSHLMLDYLYHWSFAGKNFKILRLQPLTENPQKYPERQPLSYGVTIPYSKKTNNTSTKVSILSSKYFPDSDGNFVELENLNQNKMDETLALARDLGTKLLILELKNLSNATEVKSFLNLKNKLRLTNIALSIPTVSSFDKFAQIKKNLVSLGVKFQGSLKLYLKMSIPENFINLNNYLEIGLDGIIIDFDKLASYLIGEDSLGFDPTTLINFVSEPISKFQKNRVLFWATGQNCLNDQLLKYIVSKGVTGLVLKENQFSGIREHLIMLEKANLVSLDLD